MNLSRRRMIGIVAAAALPWASTGHAAPGVTWRGRALGAEASITLAHADERHARATLDACHAEIRRLERIFSLFRRDSAITRLNDKGRLSEAPSEMRDLLGIAHHLSDISGGAFDVTVQPLWQAYAKGACYQRAIDDARSLVDWQAVIVRGRSVEFEKPGMAITMNGIAQGYITDRITDRLRDAGFHHVLVQMGEYRGLGRRADGLGWQIGIAPGEGGDIAESITLNDEAIATSSPMGTGLRCDDDQIVHHLLDPRSGAPASGWQSVSVVADRAVIADGLSTTITVAKPDLAGRLLREGGGRRAYLLGSGGQQVRLQSPSSGTTG